jgi:hypothetical protein
MPLTIEERKNSVAALANSLQKPASLRPESLLDAYRTHYGDARVIIDEFWRPCMSWAPRFGEKKKPTLIRFVESLDD